MNPLGIDIETCSGVDIKRTGAWAYSLHKSTDVHCIAYGFDPGRVGIWTPADPVPLILLQQIKSGGHVLAHNAAFEDAIFRHILGPRYGFPVPDRCQWEDTMALACAINLPASLDGLAVALGTAAQKDLAGGKLMREMAKREKRESDGVWVNNPKFDEPKHHKALQEYCRLDVATMLHCYRDLPRLGQAEQEVYRADQAVNERGVWIDFEFAGSMREMAQKRVRELNKIAQVESLGALTKATAVPAMKTWLNRMGVRLPTRNASLKVRQTDERRVSKVEKLDAETVEMLLHDPVDGVRAMWGTEGSERVRRVLTARVEANRATSLSKLDRLEGMIDGRDGRLRNIFRYCGATTGRWTSHELQAHNLPKNKMLKDDALSAAVHQAVENGDLDSLIVLVKEPMGALSQVLRSIIAAPPGRELIAGDFSAIEARVLAWLADEKVSLDRFRRGEDIYLATADEVGYPGDRPLGKEMELGLGYGMGAVTFATRYDRSLKLSAKLVKAWRNLRMNIVSYWAEVEEAAHTAVREPGRMVVIRGRCVALSDGTCLRIRLPSGRELHYWRPEIVHSERVVRVVAEDGTVEQKTIEGPELQFFHPGGTGMQRSSTYSGKLVENITQAVARDLLAWAKVRIEREPGYDVILHVHDSIAAEVDAGTGSEDWFRRALEYCPKWAAGLPVAAEVYRARRFRG